MNNIDADNICQLFRIISKRVWDKIIFNHFVNTEVSEIGLTNDIIAIIRHYSLKRGTIEIRANNGRKENLYGSDIDIFVEQTKGMFVWYALQAKVLKLNGGYNMAAGRDGEYQWDKLKRLNSLTKCVTKYLLYNGVFHFDYSSVDICNNRFQSHQFGCTLISPNKVKEIILNKTKVVAGEQLISPYAYFDDFHPEFADPWRTLTCCNSKEVITLFSAWQIKAALRYYPQKLTEIGVVDNYSDRSEEELKAKNRDIPNIRTSNEEVGRFPKYAMVIAKP